MGARKQLKEKTQSLKHCLRTARLLDMKQYPGKDLSIIDSLTKPVRTPRRIVPRRCDIVDYVHVVMRVRARGKTTKKNTRHQNTISTKVKGANVLIVRQSEQDKS